MDLGVNMALLNIQDLNRKKAELIAKGISSREADSLLSRQIDSGEIKLSGTKSLSGEISKYGLPGKLVGGFTGLLERPIRSGLGTIAEEVGAAIPGQDIAEKIGGRLLTPEQQILRSQGRTGGSVMGGGLNEAQLQQMTQLGKEGVGAASLLVGRGAGGQSLSNAIRGGQVGKASLIGGGLGAAGGSMAGLGSSEYGKGLEGAVSGGVGGLVTGGILGGASAKLSQINIKAQQKALERATKEIGGLEDAALSTKSRDELLGMASDVTGNSKKELSILTDDVLKDRIRENNKTFLQKITGDSAVKARNSLYGKPTKNIGGNQLYDNLRDVGVDTTSPDKFLKTMVEKSSEISSKINPVEAKITNNPVDLSKVADKLDDYITKNNTPGAYPELGTRGAEFSKAVRGAKTYGEMLKMLKQSGELGRWTEGADTGISNFFEEAYKLIRSERVSQLQSAGLTDASKLIKTLSILMDGNSHLQKASLGLPSGKFLDTGTLLAGSAGAMMGSPQLMFFLAGLEKTVTNPRVLIGADELARGASGVGGKIASGVGKISSAAAGGAGGAGGLMAGNIPRLSQVPISQMIATSAGAQQQAPSMIGGQQQITQPTQSTTDSMGTGGAGGETFAGYDLSQERLRQMLETDAIENGGKNSQKIVDWYTNMVQVAQMAGVNVGGAGGDLGGGVSRTVLTQIENLPTGGERTGAAEAYNLLLEMKQAKEILDSGVETGPIVSRGRQIGKLFDAVDPRAIELEQSLERVFTIGRKEMTGVQFSPKEIVELEKIYGRGSAQEGVLSEMLSNQISDLERALRIKGLSI